MTRTTQRTFKRPSSSSVSCSSQKRIPAVVDFVKSASRFTVLVPRDNAKLTLVLSGIRAPRSARGPGDAGEPFGKEAHDLSQPPLHAA